MDTLITDRVAAHVDYVQRLLKLMSKPETTRAVQTVFTHGQDEGVPAVGRLALIGTAATPRVAEITKVTPTRVQASYLTESGLRHGRTLMAHNSYPIQFDSWPESFRDNARRLWATDPIGRLRFRDAESYSEHHYEWALTTQALYRTVKHCPWVAFVSIHNTTITRAKLVMVPEIGGIE